MDRVRNWRYGERDVGREACGELGGKMTDQVQAQSREWTRQEVEATLRTVLVDSLGVQESEVEPSSSIIRDLGAESIDFLDLGFKIQQTFEVDFQASEIRNRVLAWGALILPTLAEVLEAQYGVKVAYESLVPLEGGGITKILEHVRSSQGPALEADAVTRVGRELLHRLNKEFATMGLVVKEADEQDLLAIMKSDLSSRRVIERLMDLLTVEVLVNLVCANLGTRLRAA
jgi:acyl carrier protein